MTGFHPQKKEVCMLLEPQTRIQLPRNTQKEEKKMRVTRRIGTMALPKKEKRKEKKL